MVPYTASIRPPISWCPIPIMLQEMRVHGIHRPYTVWWYCPKIALFWKDVSALISSANGVNHPPTPETALFSISLDKWPHKAQVFLTHVLFAPRRSLANAWKSDCAPSLITVIDFLNTHPTFEKMLHKFSAKPSHFRTTGRIGPKMTETQLGIDNVVHVLSSFCFQVATYLGITLLTVHKQALNVRYMVPVLYKAIKWTISHPTPISSFHTLLPSSYSLPPAPCISIFITLFIPLFSFFLWSISRLTTLMLSFAVDQISFWWTMALCALISVCFVSVCIRNSYNKDQ